MSSSSDQSTQTSPIPPPVNNNEALEACRISAESYFNMHQKTLAENQELKESINALFERIEKIGKQNLDWQKLYEELILQNEKLISVCKESEEENTRLLVENQNCNKRFEAFFEGKLVLQKENERLKSENQKYVASYETLCTEWKQDIERLIKIFEGSLAEKNTEIEKLKSLIITIQDRTPILSILNDTEIALLRRLREENELLKAEISDVKQAARNQTQMGSSTEA
jgi:hypothetical protein